MLPKSVVLHETPRYWAGAAKFTDSKFKNYRIAVTAGPTQNLDNWFIYFFYGKHLQNELIYISPAKSKEIKTYRTNGELEYNSDFNLWYSRLKKNNIDLLLCLLPESVEYKWCMEHTDLFIRIIPSEELSGWGLFSLRNGAKN